MSEIKPISYERMQDSLKAAHGIELTPTSVENIGYARINDRVVQFGVMGAYEVFVRVDIPISVVVEQQPEVKNLTTDQWLARSNYLTGAVKNVKATAFEVQDNTYLRVESEFPALAGLNDEQLLDVMNSLMQRALIAMNTLVSPPF